MKYKRRDGVLMFALMLALFVSGYCKTTVNQEETSTPVPQIETAVSDSVWNGNGAESRFANDWCLYLGGDEELRQYRLGADFVTTFQIYGFSELLYVDNQWLYCTVDSLITEDDIWRVPIRRTDDGREFLDVEQAEQIVQGKPGLDYEDAPSTPAPEEKQNAPFVYDSVAGLNTSQIYFYSHYLAFHSGDTVYLCDLEKNEFVGYYDILIAAEKETLILYEEEEGIYYYNLETNARVLLEKYSETVPYTDVNLVADSGDSEYLCYVREKYGLEKYRECFDSGEFDVICFDKKNKKRKTLISAEQIVEKMEEVHKIDFAKDAGLLYKPTGLFCYKNRYYFQYNLQQKTSAGYEARNYVMSFQIDRPDSLRYEKNINELLQKNGNLMKYRRKGDNKPLSRFPNQIKSINNQFCYVQIYWDDIDDNEVYCYDLDKKTSTQIHPNAPGKNWELTAPYYGWEMEDDS